MRRRCLVLALLGLFGCQGKGQGPNGQAAAARSGIVEFEGRTTTGDPVNLADYRGRVVLVNVWASWCGPCKKELPELKAMHRAHGDDFSVLGISVDKPRNRPAVLGLMGQFGIDYPVVLDPDGASTQAFGVHGYPTSVLIDRNGEVRWRREGIIQPGDTEAETAIAAALGAG